MRKCREVWEKLYLSQATVKELDGSGDLKVADDAASCDRALDLFDKFDSERQTLAAPAGHQHH